MATSRQDTYEGCSIRSNASPNHIIKELCCNLSLSVHPIATNDRCPRNHIFCRHAIKNLSSLCQITTPSIHINQSIVQKLVRPKSTGLYITFYLSANTLSTKISTRGKNPNKCYRIRTDPT
uniref:Uncharacterized protein n=1 Tax=Rhizophora mucronata TaxID=61149 RepID=A0A2P2J8B3_RHIMU